MGAMTAKEEGMSALSAAEESSRDPLAVPVSNRVEPARFVGGLAVVDVADCAAVEVELLPLEPDSDGTNDEGATPVVGVGEREMKHLDWYVKISIGAALVGASMELFMIKTGFCV
ncbi:hypothetical protein Tsubulata_040075 [Turnera subulata]|uniref:Uncharacterized protein n=1 Tax=Turnera subulata TaxID=218843 RepID=A0A9Q0FCR5_9ROSI|nr:hypothetical protein Tsubulata_040075 [Turnera subulata]